MILIKLWGTSLHLCFWVTLLFFSCVVHCVTGVTWRSQQSYCGSNYSFSILDWIQRNCVYFRCTCQQVLTSLLDNKKSISIWYTSASGIRQVINKNNNKFRVFSNMAGWQPFAILDIWRILNIEICALGTSQNSNCPF